MMYEVYFIGFTIIAFLAIGYCLIVEHKFYESIDEIMADVITVKHQLEQIEKQQFFDEVTDEQAKIIEKENWIDEELSKNWTCIQNPIRIDDMNDFLRKHNNERN